ncbi:MAG TPA: GatB/YqeY domain-containing protein [Deltaproteobacteria bacterium]|nr:GatB/YqeY domain-containing protein [Deltaproteobacteria bacterium]HPP80735.1 GatB/YqeY domain-containing protein [Deltaproteobacteria bacterium]
MLVERIKADLEAAMKAQDRERTSCLRMAVSAIKYRQVALNKDLDDQEVVRVLKSQVKQVTESLEAYEKGGRQDLAAIERKNLEILKSYLPPELDEEGIRSIAREIIEQTGATKKDFGKVMKLVMAKVAGQADGKIVNSIVNSLLQ